MTQTLVLNLVGLTVLVLLLSAIYRQRASARLRLWMVAWVGVLLHFGVLLWQPTLVPLIHLHDALAISLLVLCGISFLVSIGAPEGHTRIVEVATALGAPCLAFVWLATFDTNGLVAYLLLELLGHAVALVLLWYFYRNRLVLAVTGTALIMFCSHLILYAVLRGQHEAAVEFVLMELFASYALLYAGDQRQGFTAGTLTTAIGLLCWALVFPVGLGFEHRWTWVHVDDQVWNLPKFAVALGMIVSLLEEEIRDARRHRAQYQLLFEQNPLPMWISESEGERRIVEVNHAAVAGYGYERDELVGRAVAEMLQGPGNGAVKAGEGDFGTGKGTWKLRRASGEDRVVETAANPVRFGDRDAQLMMVQDVTERERLHEQLIHQANHDPLTGLPNRLLLEDRMKGALASAARHGTRVAVLCLDLDRFKQINDTYGHAAGDSCLIEVAARLRHRLRNVDTAARTGGEEFMVILEEVKSSGDAGRVTEDLLFAISAPHVADGKRITMSASAGVAMYPDDARQPEDLWRMADLAMYQAKGEGGNQMRFFSAGREQQRER